MTDALPLLGALAGLAASAFWAIASVLYSRVPIRARSIATFKNVFATVLIGVLLVATKSSDAQSFFTADRQAWTYLLLSGIIGLFVGDIAYFRSLQLIGPRLGVTLTLLSPPIISYLGTLFLNEGMTLQNWMAIGVTIFGLGMVLQDRAATTQEANSKVKHAVRWGVAYALLNILCHCSGSILLKLGTQNIGTIEATFIRLLSATIVMLPMGIFSSQKRELLELTKKRNEFFRLCQAAFMGTFLGVWLMLISFKFCPAGIAATMTSTSPIFVIPIVWFWMGTRTSRFAIIGALIAFAGVCWLLLPTASAVR